MTLIVLLVIAIGVCIAIVVLKNRHTSSTQTSPNNIPQLPQVTPLWSGVTQDDKPDPSTEYTTDGVCSVYYFESSNTELAYPTLRDVQSATIVNNPICYDQDMIPAQKNTHICVGNSNPFPPNLAGKCVSMSGDIVNPGTIESYYTTCNVQMCNGTLAVIVPESTYNNTVIDTSSANMLGSLDISGSFPPQLMRIEYASYEGGVFKPDPNGIFMRITDRSTGKYLGAGSVYPDQPSSNNLILTDITKTSRGLDLQGYWWVSIGALSYDTVSGKFVTGDTVTWGNLTNVLTTSPYLMYCYDPATYTNSTGSTLWSFLAVNCLILTSYNPGLTLLPFKYNEHGETGSDVYTSSIVPYSDLRGYL